MAVEQLFYIYVWLFLQLQTTRGTYISAVAVPREKLISNHSLVWYGLFAENNDVLSVPLKALKT